MADDMKVSVDITADLSKLESSLNTAYEKTRAAGAKMQSALNIQAGASGASTGPGAASVAPAFSSNQIAFGGGLNVQRGANYGYDRPIGPPAPSAAGASFGASLLNAKNLMSAGKVGLAAYATNQMYDTVGGVAGAIRFGGAGAFGSSDPSTYYGNVARQEDALRSIPVIGSGVSSLLGMTRAMGIMDDPHTGVSVMQRAVQEQRRAFMGFDGGGYYGEARSLQFDRTTGLQRELATMRANNAPTAAIKEFERQSDRVFELRERELRFSREKDLTGLDVAASAGTLRMFGSDFAADQMEIANKFNFDIRYADLQNDKARSRKLARLKEVSLLSSAMKNVGMGEEMSMQGTALGGVRHGQFNPNDPVVIKALERIAAAVEDNAGGVPLAR